MINYAKLPAVSSSNLTELARMYNAVPDNRAELEDVFNFGSLVDAFLTESWRLLHDSYTLLPDGIYNTKTTIYTPDIYHQGRRLSDNCKKDPLIIPLIENSVGQYIFDRTIYFNYEGDDHAIRGKCKFDLFSKKFGIGTEFKTTACTSLSQFREAVPFFHWDRNAAWYMDLARINRYWIIGMSKKNNEVFKIPVDRESEIYKTGLAKYSLWGYRWNMLCEGFKPQTLLT